jgi:hypothetical protein
VLRNSLYIKFVIALVVLASLAVMLGSEPWGPY